MIQLIKKFTFTQHNKFHQKQVILNFFVIKRKIKKSVQQQRIKSKKLNKR